MADVANVDRWRSRDGRWTCGTSVIEPYRHRQIVCDERTESESRCFVVRERRIGGDSLTVQIDHGRVRLTAGPLGTAPLYVSAVHGVVRASWDVAELAGSVSRAQVNPRVVVRLLTRRHRYCSETLFSGITRLTERSTITSDGQLVVPRYPPDSPHVLQARTLSPDADPVAALDVALADILASVVESHGSDRVAVEVSGGLDSANVALSAARVGTRAAGPLSVGLLVRGPLGQAQQTRRSELVSVLGMRDSAVPMSEYLPFSVPARRARAHDGDGEVYAEAFDALRAAALDAGAEVMLSGFGGDEMMALRVSEQPARPRPTPLPGWLSPESLGLLETVETNIAPTSAVAVPCLMTAAARHPAYLRARLWPIAPLAQPDLLRLGESLPVQWRTRKALLRQRLVRAGFSRSLTHPARPESFGPTMRCALYRYGPALLDKMRRESILIDLGYLDADCLAQHAELLRARRPVSPLLYDTIALELALTSMVRTRHDALSNR